MAQQTVNNGESGLVVRGKINSNFTELYSGKDAVTVNTYADLPAATAVPNQRYWVLQSTGVWLVNRQTKGAYYSDGIAWSYLGDFPTAAGNISNTPAGTIAASNVQTAINELDGDVGALTSVVAGKENTGVAAAGDAAHVAAADPHPQYLTAAEGNAAYQPLATVLTNTTAAFTTAQETKLSGIAAGATANSSDAILLARGNHTGTNAVGVTTFLATSRILGRSTAGAGVGEELSGAQVKTILAITNADVLGLGTLATQNGTFSGASSGTNTGDQTSIVGITGTSAEFNAALTGADFATGGGTAIGTNTGDQTTITGNAGTATALQAAGADRIKLDGIAAGATANSSDAFLLSRANHTGTQAGSTVTGAYTANGMTLATARLLGRTTALAGAAEEISVGAGLTLTAGVLDRVTQTTVSGNAGTATALATPRSLTSTGDVTWTVTFDGSANVTAAGTIAAGSVTLAKMTNLAANSFIGNNTGLAAVPLALTTAQAKTLLAIAFADVSGLGTMATQGAGAVAITGGTINTATVGLTTPAQGIFTNLTATSGVYFPQGAPVAANATATLTIANLLAFIITSTNTVAVSLTLPTGTLTDAGILGGALAVDRSFEWTHINLGSTSGAVTLVAGTGHTIVGSAVIAIGTSATFRTRKTAANTFVTYRI